MNRRWKRYPEYRDSGVAWLGEVPSHWEVRRLRFRADFNPPRSEANHLPADSKVSFIPMEAVGELGGLDLSDVRTLEAIGSGYTWFQDGDVVVAKITPCFENGKGALAEGLTNGAAFGTTELHVVRPCEGLDARFLFYLTLSHPFRAIGASTMYGAGGQKRVPDTFIRNFRPGIPPDEREQRTIATFLDRETGRIDALIAKKEELIRLLEEKRAALISHVVTKGLDPNVPMKDSRVEWFDTVPVHWECLPLKRRWTVRDCKHVTPEYVDDGIPLVSTTEVKPGTLDLSGCFRFIEEEWFAHMTGGGRLPRRGDIIYSRNASLGAAAYVDSDERFAMGQDVVLITSPGRDQKFLSHVLNAEVVTEQVVRLQMGSTFSRINVDDIKALIVPVPPIPEQEAIADHIDGVNQSVEQIAAALRASAELLREHRQALITAAVTGKIDLRDEVAS